ncbi:hypothetical protein [Variovorax sp. KK3]|uniref:hypothetical protein n=1 Tax=Variovorax sp. KK3 TaxID=1855728 RepID=UPI003AABBFC1
MQVAVPLTVRVIQRVSAPYFTSVEADTVNEAPSLASTVPAAGTDGAGAVAGGGGGGGGGGVVVAACCCT